MSEVLCWCCEHYFNFDDLKICEGKIVNGTCILKKTLLSASDTVCEEFVLRRGLYTNRTIPNYCKNYNKTKE